MLKSLKEIDEVEKLLMRPLSLAEQEYVTLNGAISFLNNLGLDQEDIETLKKIKETVSNYCTKTEYSLDSLLPFFKRDTVIVDRVIDTFKTIITNLLEEKAGPKVEDQLDDLAPDNIEGTDEIPEEITVDKLFPEDFEPWLDYLTPTQIMEYLRNCKDEDNIYISEIEIVMRSIKAFVKTKLAQEIILSGWGIIENEEIRKEVFRTLISWGVAKKSILDTGEGIKILKK